MHSLISFILGSLIFILSACAAPSAPIATEQTPKPELTITPPHIKDKYASAAETELCEAIGGIISRQGLAGFEMCVVPYKDAGKTCRDSADCLGQCRTDNAVNIGESTTGLCQANNIPFGCFTEVKNGRAQPGLCVD